MIHYLCSDPFYYTRFTAFSNYLKPGNTQPAMGTWSCMLQLEVLICKLLAVDAPATSSIVLGEVTSLAHEVRDDPVESAALESEALLACAQGTEVLGCLWNHISTQLK